jgi:hypothetical protein
VLESSTEHPSPAALMRAAGEWLTTAQAGELLGIRPNAVCALVSHGTLRARRKRRGAEACRRRSRPIQARLLVERASVMDYLHYKRDRALRVAAARRMLAAGGMTRAYIARVCGLNHSTPYDLAKRMRQNAAGGDIDGYHGATGGMMVESVIDGESRWVWVWA